VSPAPGRPIRLEAAAGGAGGSWYVLLEGLARLVRDVHPWIELRVIEGGGVMNHTNVGTGRVPVAILNPPMTVAARAGRPPFDQALPDLRIGIANLTVNHLQFMVDRDVPIGELRDWPARRYPLRIPVDRVGTVDRLVFELALDQCAGELLLQRKEFDVQIGEPPSLALGFGPARPRSFEIAGMLSLDFRAKRIVRQPHAGMRVHGRIGRFRQALDRPAGITMRAGRDERCALYFAGQLWGDLSLAGGSADGVLPW